MAPQEKTDVFELYTRAFKSWADVFSSYSRTWAAPGEASGTPDLSGVFKPWWDFLDNWMKMGHSFGEMARDMKMPFDSVRYGSRAVAGGIEAYLKIYDAWLSGTQKIVSEGFEASRQLSSGQSPDTAAFFEALKSTGERMSAAVAESLKDTPFSGIPEIDQVVRKSLESFPEEQRVARDFLQGLFDFTVRTAKLSAEAMAQAVRTFSEMRDKGTISTGAYNEIIEDYGNLLKQSAEVLRPTKALFPGYKELVDDAIQWSRTYLDLHVRWLETGLRLQKAVADSYSTLSRNAQELLSQGKPPAAPVQLAGKWAEAYQQAGNAFMETSQLASAIPEMVQLFTESMKATGNLYRSASRIPFATREELEQVAAQMEKAKRPARRSKAPDKPGAPRRRKAKKAVDAA